MLPIRGIINKRRENNEVKSHLVVKFDERREISNGGFNARQSFNRRAPNASCNYILPERIVYTSRELVLCAHFPALPYTRTYGQNPTSEFARHRVSRSNTKPRVRGEQVPSFIITEEQTTHARVNTSRH